MDPRERAVARCQRHRGGRDEMIDGVLSTKRWYQQRAEERWDDLMVLVGGVLVVWDGRERMDQLNERGFWEPKMV